MKIKVDGIFKWLLYVGKILAFMSLVMTVTIKTRQLLGLKTKVNEDDNED